MNKEAWFYFPEKGKTSLSEEESFHAVKVLRKRPGDLITGFDGKGGKFRIKLDKVGPKICEVSVIGEEFFPNPYDSSLTIAIAPPKSQDRLSTLIEKLTEIGVNKIQFLVTERSERPRVNMKRVQRVMVAAAKQCGNLHMPLIKEPMDFVDWHSTSISNEKYICHLPERNEPQPLITALKGSNSVCIAIGPEGDFSHNEIVMARVAGFESAGLGPQVLRTETAAIVASTIARAKSLSKK